MARGRGRGRRTDYVWSLGTFETAALSAGSVAGTLFTTTDPSTMYRLRGTLFCGVDGVASPGRMVRVTAGIIVVPAGTGSTVTVTPFANSSADWIWYTTFIVGYEEFVTDVTFDTNLVSYREVIDNKAMRRLKDEQELQCVVVNTTAGGAEEVNFSLGVRILVGS